jgi:hypothetical protein
MLRKEITITPPRILELSSFQGIIDFFAELGYNTAIDSTPEKDTATQHELHRHDDLSSKIASFRRIAQKTDETNTTLYVYFYVLKSVTAKAREDIVRDLLRRHSGEYLFILTSELTPFKELEFVYIDRISGNEQNQAVVQPTLFDDHPPAPVGPPQIRTLSVDCRHPDYKAVRLLRGLPYTHRYVLEQCKAISSAYDRAETSEEFFHNRSLFSDHYLKKRLPEEVVEWLQTDQEGFESDALTEVSSAFRRLYAGANKAFAGKSKSELRQLLFEPVLELLGFAWDVPHKNTKRENQDERRLPDYTLAMKEADGSPLAICLVYPWERNLDDYFDSDEDNPAFSVDPTMTNENPSAVVVSLLEQEQVNWAILTNGRFWRLYSTRARSRATNYYEIDLLETLAIRRERTEDALKALRYFWLFFRADAFSPKPRPDYETPPYICFLDYILRESERYARALGESLKERIFDDIFPYFARGFVHYAQYIGHLPQDLGKQTLEERTALLQPFFEGTLAFLYRLLFLLYAESRDLLPVHDVRYHTQSLTRMKEEIAAIAKNNKVQAPRNIEERFPEDVAATDLYGRLQVLFKAIDQGDDELNVPTYNGGLFMTEVDASKSEEILIPDERAARFLATYRIPNRELALGLDLMARDEDERKGKATKREFELAYVDYKSLGVRQLGSIYEGLLEFKLRIAVERMVVLKGKVQPLQEAIEAGQYKPGKTKAAIYEPNTVYIENDRHERKATGSYYTPDYIVKYIIEQTVGPLLQDRFEKLLPRFREYQRAMQNRVKDNEKRQSMKISAEDPYKTYKKYERLADEFFDLKILDPAMGSGHFLVDAVDYITDKMTEFLRPLAPNPVHQKLQEIRGNIVAEVEAQNVSIDRARLNELNLLKRQVLKRCVFGVDVNYMAVTLTKVSLWLDTFTQGAPLSFLDYHLKWGNSLIGTTLSKVEKESEGLWFARDLSRVLSSADLARRLSLGTDSTPREIAEAHQVYDQLLDQVQPYKSLLDVWVSQYFGNKWARTTVESCVDAILDQNLAAMKKSNQESYKLAQDLASRRNKNFFHWELEFPEVFFRDNQRLSESVAGFDAVIGNPPYSSINNELVKRFCHAQFESAEYQLDTYVAFVEQGINLAHVKGFLGFIIPTTYIGMHYFSKLRGFILTHSQPINLIKLKFPVFDDATVESSVAILQRTGIDQSNQQSFLGKAAIYNTLASFLQQDQHPISFKVQDILSLQGNDFFFLQESSNLEFIKRLQAVSLNLTDICDMTVGVKPYQTGKGVPKQTATVVQNRVFDSNYKLDETYKQYLMGRDIKRYRITPETERWISYGEWLAEPRQSAPFFEPSKILIRQTADSIIAAYDVDQFVTLNNIHNLKLRRSPLEELYVLAFLNSKLATYYHRAQVGETGRVFAEVKLVDLGKLPIHRVNFITPQELRSHYQDEITLLYKQFVIDTNDSPLLDFVDRFLMQQPEASDVVHDLLAYLAERMLSLNKEMWTFQTRFLKFLEAKLEIQPQPDPKSGKVGLEALTKRKDLLLNYPRDYRKGENVLPFTTVESILKDNKQHFRQYLDSRLLHEIENEYTKDIELIEALKRQLQLTDDLIDEVVYVLYRLTEEEKKVVRGEA